MLIYSKFLYKTSGDSICVCLKFNISGYKSNTWISQSRIDLRRKELCHGLSFTVSPN